MKKSVEQRVFDIFNYVILGVFTLLAFYPILNQIAISFSSANGVLFNTITIFPIEFTFETYAGLLAQNDFWIKYQNSIQYTVLGTLVSLFMTATLSFALAKKDLYGGNLITKMIVFTMFFSGGLIPNYALIRNLNLMDNMWAILLPTCILPYHMLIMRTFFQNLPAELEEASRLDGLGQFGYFIQIALPLSKPIIATMVLFISVIYWNDWFSALLYINTPDKQPVTLYLRNVLMGANAAAMEGNIDATSAKSVPQSLQAASTMLVIAPILCVYPFVQKYFVKGVMIGAVKG